MLGFARGQGADSLPGGVDGPLTKAEVVGALATVLAPYLGETMARASTRTHCDKLGIRDDEVTAAQIDALVGKLASGLNVFVGREKAKGVHDEMKRAMAGLTVPS
jgi:hypothetical protein